MDGERQQGSSLMPSTILQPPPSMLASNRCLSLSVSMTDTEPDMTLSSQSISTTSVTGDSRFHVSLAEFAKYARQLPEPINEVSGDGFDEELEELHRRCMAANLKQNIYMKSMKLSGKNRYSDILPYTQTRVVLSEIEKIPDSDYINANYIKSHVNGCSTTYISTQAPLPNTIPDFWRMVWEQKSTIVVMLTPLHEKNLKKSDMYWPKKLGKPKHFDNGIEICLKSEARSPDMITRLLEIRSAQFPHEVRTVTHMHYLGWPDHSVPISFESYLTVFSLYRSIREKSSGPVIVHCSAGIGRTGTFIGVDIAVDALIYILKHGRPTDTICLLDIVYSMRTQRAGMVQTKAQYQFIYEFLGYCLERQHLNLRLCLVNSHMF